MSMVIIFAKKRRTAPSPTMMNQISVGAETQIRQGAGSFCRSRQRSASVKPASRMMPRCVPGLRSWLPWTGTTVRRPVGT
jgi:hypothetical protein